MKKLFLTVTILMISIGNYAQAQLWYNPCCIGPSTNFYLEILGGANFLDAKTNDGIKSDYKTGYIVAGSLGYRFCEGLRLEFEYAYRRNSLNKVHFFGRSFSIGGHFQSSSFMGNLLWDVPFGCCGIQPFIGGGVGSDIQQVHGSGNNIAFHQKNKNFAWQVIGGFSYPILCNLDLSLQYKFHKGGLSYIYIHSVGIGLRYNFG